MPPPRRPNTLAINNLLFLERLLEVGELKLEKNLFSKELIKAFYLLLLMKKGAETEKFL